MKLEHVALNVSDPVAMTAWYCEHFKMQVVRHIPQPNQTHFLSDCQASVLEIYRNPSATIPDYRSLDALVLHLAFISADPIVDSRRLIDAGAALDGEVRHPDGSHLIMLRDPWGVAVQLCQRKVPLLG